VVRVSNPGIGAGEGKLDVEIDLEVGGHVLVVQEYRFNLCDNKYNN
jgi:hypothetical protein